MRRLLAGSSSRVVHVGNEPAYIHDDGSKTRAGIPRSYLCFMGAVITTCFLLMLHSRHTAVVSSSIETYDFAALFEPTREYDVLEGDGSTKDGSDTRTFEYLGHPCNQRRYQLVAREVVDRQCRNVAEIGGYLTPLDGFLAAYKGNLTHDINYVNIDPSIDRPVQRNTRMNTKSQVVASHVPLSITEFMNWPNSGKHALGLDAKWDCVVLLGIWDPHVAYEVTIRALQRLMREAKFVALDVCDEEMEHLSEIESFLPEDDKCYLSSHRFDCSKEVMTGAKDLLSTARPGAHHAGDSCHDFETIEVAILGNTKLDLDGFGRPLDQKDQYGDWDDDHHAYDSTDDEYR